jgi:glucan phosphoethanolaminetransferase (alkaline phosphatase superfamily)
MFLTAVLLIGLGIICLILTVIALIFGVIAFANSKPNKFIWLTVFLCSIIGLLICIFTFVRKTVNAVENLTENAIGQFESFGDSLSKLESVDQHQANSNSAQIQLLKSYLDPAVLNNEPEEFYSYLGFKDYYRYPLRYPFSIHSNFEQTNGELYNEKNVSRFDENDNGEIYIDIDNINKIAFDKNYLLIEQTTTSTRTDKIIYHYILFDFNKEIQVEAKSLQNLVKLAKQKGYSGTDTLITLRQYNALF